MLLLKTNYYFDGKFDYDSPVNSLPKRLVLLTRMILEGTGVFAVKYHKLRSKFLYRYLD